MRRWRSYCVHPCRLRHVSLAKAVSVVTPRCQKKGHASEGGLRGANCHSRCLGWDLVMHAVRLTLPLSTIQAWAMSQSNFDRLDPEGWWCGAGRRAQDGAAGLPGAEGRGGGTPPHDPGPRLGGPQCASHRRPLCRRAQVRYCPTGCPLASITRSRVGPFIHRSELALPYQIRVWTMPVRATVLAARTGGNYFERSSDDAAITVHLIRT